MKSNWIQKSLPIVLGILVMMTALPKLMGVEMAVENFKNWNLNDDMRIVTGVFELILGLGVILKPSRGIAGLGVLLLMSAGFITHIAANELEMLAMPIAFGLLTFWMMVSQGYLKLKS